MKAAQTPVAPRENPLVPFALMKRMYAGMVESRLLETAVAKAGGAGEGSPIEGQEACRAALLLSLEADDLVFDRAGATSSAWLRGADLGEIVTGHSRIGLPSFKDASQQLAAAVGASAALKRMKQLHVVALFIDAATKRSVLQGVFSMAAAEELPMVFVAFGSATGKSIAGEATRLGVPGIPVEAHDTVAICRVAQESILRARAGGGPALIECVRLDDGKRALDPIAAMGKILLRVGACDRAWLDAVAPAFRARLRALKHQRSA